MNEMVERFVRSARANEDSIAVQEQERSFTFAELLVLTQRFAAVFGRAAEVPRVLIDLPQGGQAYAAEIGVLMAGGTFCPVDPSLPDPRLREIVSLFSPDIICAHGSPGWANSRACVDPVVLESVAPLDNIRPAAEHAYVIFTSGSTGHPKGVQIRSRSLPPFFNWVRGAFRPTATDRWAQFSRLSFDLSIVDLFGALTSGATLIPVTGPADRLLPGRFIKREGITIWHSVPSIIPSMLELGAIHDEPFLSLRLASFCGEPLYHYYLEHLFKTNPHLVVFNTYGPTEGTLFCSCQRLVASSYTDFCEDTAAIGEAIPGWKLILTPSDEATDPATFEITVAGDYIGAGYLGGLPEDHARFIDVREGPRLTAAFRTGDFVRRKSGKLYFEGRRDRQVKVRGHRLELGEVERALLDLGAQEAHAFLKDGVLHAAVRGLPESAADRWREALHDRVPQYAVPAGLFLLDEFPRLSSGKIDFDTLRNSGTGGV